MSNPYVDVVLAFLGLLLLRHVWKVKTSAPLPPGPKGLPLIGNILDIPQSHEWLTYSKWAQQWGKNHFTSAPPSYSNLVGL